ncbi:hypothetical protein B0A55_10079 [Friedmanniomyces simplex]|uniref:ornithine aminotransferase n=1 Tax=Friedmanniomyces simplex TaxID=329884 RepID=A0A4U0WW55_9PEZI|nr:hypothetical protein B0A55_10079 [Friedmanniomyces simplex]
MWILLCQPYGVACNYGGDAINTELQHSGEAAFIVEPYNPEPAMLPSDASAQAPGLKALQHLHQQPLPQTAPHLNQPLPPTPPSELMLGMLNYPLTLHETDDTYRITESDLDRLRRFQDRTVLTIGTAQTIHIFRDSVLKLGLDHDYVTHIIFTIVLMHDRYLSEDPWQPPTTEETFHHYHGTAMFNKMLSSPIEEHEKDAMWAAAALLGAITIAAVDATTPEQSWPLKPDGPTDLDWLRMSDGKKEVWRLANPLRQQSIWRVAMMYDYDSDITPKSRRPEIDALMPRLVRFFNYDDSVESSEDPYHTATSIILRLLPIQCTHSTVLYFLSFVGHMDTAYKDLLHQKDQKALLLLAWWYAKMLDYPSWWIQRRAALECKAICIYLGQRYMHQSDVGQLLDFPKMMCGFAVSSEFLRNIEEGRGREVGLGDTTETPPKMAPMAIDEHAQTNGHANGNGTLNAKAATFTPSTSASPSSPYHAASSASAMDTEASFAAHNYHPLPIVFAKASGCSVWDPEGKHYLDFLSAYSAVNQGHCHPKLIQALTEQAGRLTLSSRAFYNDVFPKFAEKITKMTGFDMVLPMNTGAEAENFHGRTFAAITMSTDPESRDNYGPYLPNVGPVCPATKKVIPYNDVKAVEEAFEAHGKETAGFLVEPIQGEAGIVVPDEDYLKRIRELCDKHNVLLICDEIQTGIARTGRLLCHEWSGIKPDLVLLGKAISGGMYPVSCVLGSKDVMLTIEPGTHGSTYGGNPLGSAVAIKALEIVEEEQLVERAERLGELFRQGLRDIQSRDPMIKIIRGKGLLNAMIIDENKTGGHTAWDLCMLMKEKGLLVGRALKIAHQGAKDANANGNGDANGTPASTSLLDQGANAPSSSQAKPTHQNIIRMAPPLVITEEQIRTALGIIDEAMRELPGLKGEKEREVLPEGEKGVKIGLEN